MLVLFVPHTQSLALHHPNHAYGAVSSLALLVFSWLLDRRGRRFTDARRVTPLPRTTRPAMPCVGRGRVAHAQIHGPAPRAARLAGFVSGPRSRGRARSARASGVRREAAGGCGAALRPAAWARRGAAGMDEDGLPIVGSGIDLTKVRAAVARGVGALPLPPPAAAALALVLGGPRLPPASLRVPARRSGEPLSPAAASPDPTGAPGQPGRSGAAGEGSCGGGDALGAAEPAPSAPAAVVPAAEFPQRGRGRTRRLGLSPAVPPGARC